MSQKRDPVERRNHGGNVSTERIIGRSFTATGQIANPLTRLLLQTRRKSCSDGNELTVSCPSLYFFPNTTAPRFALLRLRSIRREEKKKERGTPSRQLSVVLSHGSNPEVPVEKLT